MKRLLVVAPALLVLTSCAPRYDLFVAWTVDGEDASSGCQKFPGAKIDITLGQRDSEEGTAVDEKQSFTCKDGAAALAAASFADLKFELTSKGDTFGSAGTVHTSPGTSDSYAGSTAEDPLTVDLHVTRGRLRAHLTADGESCADAGVSSFTVTLVENGAPLNATVLAKDKAVSCSDGDAVFTFAPVTLGAQYNVIATADGYATSSEGEGVVAEDPVTDFTVDLAAE